MVDVNLKVPALEKLVDYAASGIGAVAGSMLATWKARQDAKAKLIGVQAEVDSLRLIADAQADARRSLAVPYDVGHGMLEIGPKGIEQRIEFQEKKRQANIASVAREAAAVFAQTECAVTEEALARHDVDLPYVFIDGEMHRRACRCSQTYLTAAGAVSVTRTLYRARRGERAVAPNSGSRPDGLDSLPARKRGCPRWPPKHSPSTVVVKPGSWIRMRCECKNNQESSSDARKSAQ